MSKMVLISRTMSMPTWLTSSSRPTNGLTKDAPALAARSAWLAEKMRVVLILIPSEESVLIARSPSRMIGILTTTFGAPIRRTMSRPSAIISSAVTDTTSALTGPLTMEQISRTTS